MPRLPAAAFLLLAATAGGAADAAGWAEETAAAEWVGEGTAAVAVDLWDRYGCPTFEQRSQALAAAVNRKLWALRAKGVRWKVWGIGRGPEPAPQLPGQPPYSSCTPPRTPRSRTTTPTPPGVRPPNANASTRMSASTRMMSGGQRGGCCLPRSERTRSGNCPGVASPTPDSVRAASREWVRSLPNVTMPAGQGRRMEV
eukprot:gene7254-22873_t